MRKGLIVLLQSAAEARLRPSQREEQAAERGHVREGLGPIRQPKVKRDHLLRAHRYVRQLGLRFLTTAKTENVERAW